MKHAFHTSGKYRESARHALFHASNWMSSLTVTFAVLLILYAAFCITEGVSAVLTAYLPMPHIIGITVHPIRFLLLSPLAVGLLYYYTDLFRAAHGDGPSHVPPSVVFSPYASVSSVTHAWLQSLFSLILFVSIFASLAPLYVFHRMIPQFHTVPMSTLLLLGCILLLLAVLYLNARLMPAMFLSAMHPELYFGDTLRVTWKSTKDSALTGVLLQLGLLTAAVLSVFLTAGIVFFVYVLPLSVFTYVGYCHELSRRCDML